MSGIASVYATFADEAEAERIGRQLVEERLAACVNILGPCKSIYRWQGKVEEAEEEVAGSPPELRAVDVFEALAAWGGLRHPRRRAGSERRRRRRRRLRRSPG